MKVYLLSGVVIFIYGTDYLAMLKQADSVAGWDFDRLETREFTK